MAITEIYFDLTKYYTKPPSTGNNLALGGIRFYDNDNKMIPSGAVIASGYKIGETENFIVEVRDSYSSDRTPLPGVVDTSLDATNSKSSWSRVDTPDNFIKVTFKTPVQSITKITYIPQVWYNKITTYPIAIIAKSGEQVVFEYKGMPLGGQPGGIQTILTPELELNNEPPILTMSNTHIGVFEKEELINISGFVEDENETKLKLLVNENCINTNIVLGDFHQSVSQDNLNIGFNIIIISIEDDGFETVNSNPIYVFKNEEYCIVYDKSATTKDILIPETTNSVVLSAKAEGSMAIPLISTDSGETWTIGDWEEEIETLLTDKLKLMFLMSQDFKLQAYGLGWYKNGVLRGSRNW